MSGRIARVRWEQIDLAHLEHQDSVASRERFQIRPDNAASSMLRPITPFEVCPSSEPRHGKQGSITMEGQK